MGGEPDELDDGDCDLPTNEVLEIGPFEMLIGKCVICERPHLHGAPNNIVAYFVGRTAGAPSDEPPVWPGTSHREYLGNTISNPRTSQGHGRSLALSVAV